MRGWKLWWFMAFPLVPKLLREQCHLIGISMCNLCLGYSLPLFPLTNQIVSK